MNLEKIRINTKYSKIILRENLNELKFLQVKNYPLTDIKCVSSRGRLEIYSLFIENKIFTYNDSCYKYNKINLINSHSIFPSLTYCNLKYITIRNSYVSFNGRFLILKEIEIVKDNKSKILNEINFNKSELPSLEEIKIKSNVNKHFKILYKLKKLKRLTIKSNTLEILDLNFKEGHPILEIFNVNPKVIPENIRNNYRCIE